MRSIVFASAIVGSLAADAKPNMDGVTADLKRIAQGGYHNSTTTTIEASSGSMVFSYYDANQCTGSVKNAVGYVLGSCITADGESSIAYMSCSESGDSVKYTLKTCDSADCSSGCSSYDLSVSKCDSGTKMSCSSKEKAWSEVDGMTMHYEFYYGDDSCGNGVDMWTTMNFDCNDYYNIDCTDDNYYSWLGKCDLRGQS